jgi:predicted aspartyl protease
MRRHVFTLLSALSLLLCVAAVGCAPTFRPETVVVPAAGADVAMAMAEQAVAAQPIVDVFLNGCGPYRFVPDTGTTCVVVRRGLVEALGLKRGGGTARVTTPSRTFEEVPVLRIDALKLGRAEFRGVPAVAGDVPDDRVDGVLGMALFSDHLLTLDFPSRRLKLRGGRLNRGDARTLAYRARDGTPVVRVVLPLRDGSQQAAWALLDTGYNGGLDLPSSLAARLPLTRPVPPAVGGATLPAGATITRETGKDGKTLIAVTAPGEFLLNGSVRIGPYQVERTWVATGSSGPPVLGMSVLSRFALTFDQRSRLVRLDDPSPVP